MYKYLIILILLFSNLYLLKAQIFGRVFDAKTGEALAFVNIIYNEQNQGVMSGIDGKFSIDEKLSISFLKFSYVGYDVKTLTKNQIKTGENNIVRLMPKTIDLNEVVVFAKENPAHRIIKMVLKNRETNNPTKMQSFSYTSYNKMIFTVDNYLARKSDSVMMVRRAERLKRRNDSLLNIGKDSAYITKLDSTIKAKRDSAGGGLGYRSLGEMVDNQHLFLTESVSKRTFKYPDRNEEVVLANRMSGFKNPMFTLLATQMQSFSFYEDHLMLFDKTYLNPISPGSTKRYLFMIEDTVFNEAGDTTFVISYRPRKGKNITGLKGVLNISSNKYAIESVLAEPFDEQGIINVRIQQKYQFIGNKQWFPVELNSDIIMKSANVQTSEGLTLPMLGIGKSYLQDIQLNPDISGKRFSNVEIVFNEDANNKTEEFWKIYRTDTLSKQDKKTYQVIDSVSKEARLEDIMKIAETLSNGYIPYKFLHIPIDKILSYNKYEGIRLGIAARTNNKVLDWAWIGGYFAYGFKDKAIKYGYETGLKFDKRNVTSLQFTFEHDVMESAGFSFYDNRTPTTTESYRKVFIEKMDEYEKYSVAFNFPAFRYFKIRAYASKNLATNKYQTQEIADTRLPKFYTNTFAETGLQIRFAYKEKFFTTPNAKISLGTKYPIIWLNVSKNHKYFGGEFDFVKMEAKIQKEFLIRNFGKTNVQLTGGYTIGDAPYTHTYNGQGAYSRFSIDVANSFNTMRMNEFVSDRFSHLFLSHNFGSLLYKSKKFAPELVMVHNMGWGDYSKPLDNFVIPVQKMNKIYYESGIRINNLYRQTILGYGIGVFYRYGNYSLPKQSDNITIKLTFGISI
jgi:hypothetical protein